MGLDSVELVFEIERTFDITLPNDELEREEWTVRGMQQLVWKHMQVQSKTGTWTEETVGRRLNMIYHESLGVPWELIKPEARIITDFGID